MGFEYKFQHPLPIWQRKFRRETVAWFSTNNISWNILKFTYDRTWSPIFYRKTYYSNILPFMDSSASHISECFLSHPSLWYFINPTSLSLKTKKNIKSLKKGKGQGKFSFTHSWKNWTILQDCAWIWALINVSNAFAFQVIWFSVLWHF